MLCTFCLLKVIYLAIKKITFIGSDREKKKSIRKIDLSVLTSLLYLGVGSLEE